MNTRSNLKSSPLSCRGGLVPGLGGMFPEVCEVVPVKMEYEDSQGQRHILNYHVMGNGCSNG
jgi:hypothetical protein